MANKAPNFVYADKAQTNIFFEQPSVENPYVAEQQYLHGYNVLELVKKKSFIEVILLLFTKQLPNPKQIILLEKLFVGLMNLGPRHPAVKAAMVAGVSKANTEHLLPIGLTALGGHSNGAKEVESAIVFLQENSDANPESLAQQLIKNTKSDKHEGEIHLCAGFGNHYGNIDITAGNLINEISRDFDPDTELPMIRWAQKFSDALSVNNMGWLKTGVAAAVFCELGISARESVGLFQLICAPGIFAQGVEQTHMPITSIPMLNDQQHIYSK